VSPVAVAEAPPTNRGRRLPIIDHTGCPRVLVDTIGVRGEVTRDSALAMPQQRMRRDLDYVTGAFEDQVTGVMGRTNTGVRFLGDWRTGRTEAYFEVSVPRYLHGPVLDASSLADVHLALRALHGEVGSQLEWVDDVDHLRVTRIDLVRDFIDLDDVRRTLARIASVKTRSPVDVYRDKNDGALTVMRGSKARWMTRGYSKQEQMVHLSRTARDCEERETLVTCAASARGRLRFEAQVRRRVLRERRVVCVQDLTQETLEPIRHHYFDVAGFSASFGGLHNIEAAASRLQLMGTYRQLSPVLGVLLADAIGWPAPMSNRSARRYRRVAASLGLTSADIMFDGGDTTRLDYLAGSEIVGQAGAEMTDVRLAAC
jgi:hypothetical protein